MKRKRFSLLFEILKTSCESESEMTLIDVDSVKREVDFMENERKTVMVETRKSPKYKRFQLMPRVQRCAEKVERGISLVFDINSSHKNDE